MAWRWKLDKLKAPRCQSILYHLRDFSREDAYTIIECLTKRAKFNLDPKLIDVIVDGLADERNKIRPIELQVVGSQLQEEKPPIKTLDRFQQKFGINPQEAKEKFIWIERSGLGFLATLGHVLLCPASVLKTMLVVR